MAHALRIVHALSNTLSALGQGFALATACWVRCQLVGAQFQCMMLVEVVAHASLKTFGRFELRVWGRFATIKLERGYQTILYQTLYGGPPPPKKKKKKKNCNSGGKNKSLRMS
jgi:hypothetical protein